MRDFLVVFIPLSLIVIFALSLYAPYDWGSDVYEQELQAMRAVDTASTTKQREREQRLATIRQDYPFRDRDWLWNTAPRMGTSTLYLSARRSLAWGQLLLECVIGVLIAGAFAGLVWRWQQQRTAKREESELQTENRGLKLMMMASMTRPVVVSFFEKQLRNIDAAAGVKEQPRRLHILFKGIGEMARQFNGSDMAPKIEAATIEWLESETDEFDE